jgi:endonuclease-8
MPEGDTIFRTATTLGRAIAGQIVRRLRSPLPAVAAFAPAVEGRKVERVEPRGKYLLVHFEDGCALLTHMRMTGAWHIYRPGEPWQKSERAARVVIETDPFVAVCFAAPVVEMVPRGSLSRHPALSRLGPDVLRGDFDAEAARARLRARPDMLIGDALLAQGAIAGIGNVYKSEVLFLCRVNPFVPVSALSDAVLGAAIAKARELMSQNLDGFARTTTRPLPGRTGRPFVPLRGPRYFVYDRRGEPCLVCGAEIRSSRSASGREAAAPKGASSGAPSSAASGGEAARITYFCPRCQPPGATGEAPP